MQEIPRNGSNIAVGIGKKTFKIKLAGFNGEVAWSPDSKAFAVTLTEGGGGIGSNIYAFYVDKAGVAKVDVAASVLKDFGSPVQCDVPLAPNTAFVRWGADSSSIFVAAEVVSRQVLQLHGNRSPVRSRIARFENPSDVFADGCKKEVPKRPGLPVARRGRQVCGSSGALCADEEGLLTQSWIPGHATLRGVNSTFYHSRRCHGSMDSPEDMICDEQRVGG